MKRPMYHSLEINKANEELAADNLRLSQEVDSLRAELEAIELAQVTKSAEGGNNPNDTAAGSVQHQPESSSESESTLVTHKYVPTQLDADSPCAWDDHPDGIGDPRYYCGRLPNDPIHLSVHQPDVQTAELLHGVSLEMSAWLRVNPTATATHACFELMRRVESALAKT